MIAPVLTFLGATHAVTGSRFLVETPKAELTATPSPMSPCAQAPSSRALGARR